MTEIVGYKKEKEKGEESQMNNCGWWMTGKSNIFK
jgi:hypothetical protein